MSDNLAAHCYKCVGTTELSVKKHDRQGRAVYECRGCRRADYHKRRDAQGLPRRIFKKRLPQCEQCGERRELVEKDGWRKTMICKPCYKASRTEQIRHNPFKPNYACGEEWVQRARESQARIAAKYA